MDTFNIRIASYLENAINIKRLMEHGYAINVTKGIPAIVNPSAVGWSSDCDYSDVQIDFGMQTAELFDEILESCKPYMTENSYKKARMIRRFAFSVSTFDYTMSGITYVMPRMHIVGQLIAPIVDTSGTGLQIIVSGRSYKYSQRQYRRS